MSGGLSNVWKDCDSKTSIWTCQNSLYILSTVCKNEVNYSLNLKYSSYPHETITYHIVNISIF